MPFLLLGLLLCCSLLGLLRRGVKRAFWASISDKLGPRGLALELPAAAESPRASAPSKAHSFFRSRDFTNPTAPRHCGSPAPRRVLWWLQWTRICPATLRREATQTSKHHPFTYSSASCPPCAMATTTTANVVSALNWSQHQTLMDWGLKVCRLVARFCVISAPSRTSCLNKMV